MRARHLAPALGLAACVPVAGGGGAAYAQSEGAEPIVLTYAAPEGCPDRAAFVARIAARTDRFRLEADPAGRRVFSLRIDPASRGYVGEFRVVDRRGTSALRSIVGDSCDEVASALALVTALSIDPHASGAAQANATASTGGTAPAVAKLVPPPPAPPPPSPPPPPPPPHADFGPAPEPPATPVRAAPPEVPARMRATLGAGVGLDALTFRAPTAVLGERVFVEAGVPQASLWAPMARLSFVRAANGTIDAASARTHFTWLAGRAEVCPVMVRLAATLALRPCVGAEVGTLSANPTGPITTLSPRRPWAQTEGDLRAAFRPFGPLYLELSAGFGVPLVRDQFYVATGPSTSVAYQAPRITGLFGGAVGVHFP